MRFISSIPWVTCGQEKGVPAKGIEEINEPRHAIMCLREIYYVMRYDVAKSDVCFSRHA